MRRSRRWSSRIPVRVVDGPTLIAHVKTHLAGYKAPKRVVTITSVGRAANGKLDYKALKAIAAAASAES